MCNKIGFNLLLVLVFALCITYIAAEEELSNSYLDDALVNTGNFLQKIKRHITIGNNNIITGNICDGGICTFAGSQNTPGSELVVIKSTMTEEMQKDAVDCATQAMEKYKKAEDIAGYITKEFDKKYNRRWHCIVGIQFSTSVTPDLDLYIDFGLGNYYFVLFKTGEVNKNKN